MVGLLMAARAGACAGCRRSPTRAVFESPSLAVGSSKSGSPASLHVEKWMWKPEPPSSLNGFAMKVASLPSWRASSCTALLKRKARSAASSASLCHRLISNWPLENSWLAATTSTP